MLERTHPLPVTQNKRDIETIAKFLFRRDFHSGVRNSVRRCFSNTCGRNERRDGRKDEGRGKGGKGWWPGTPGNHRDGQAQDLQRGTRLLTLGLRAAGPRGE